MRIANHVGRHHHVLIEAKVPEGSQQKKIVDELARPGERGMLAAEKAKWLARAAQ